MALSNQLLVFDEVPDDLLASVESRDIGLWVQDLPGAASIEDNVVRFLGLPWRFVVMETYSERLLQALASVASVNDPMTLKRGYIQILESDPSRVELPQRCLPIYLLNGRQSDRASDFEARLRRLTMLESVRRSSPRQILVVSNSENPVSSNMADLWSSGFRSNLYVATTDTAARATVERWLPGIPEQRATLLRLPLDELISQVLARYEAVYPQERHVLRVRDRRGHVRNIDVTELDEPERPLLDRYSLIQERDLAPLVPEELSEQEFVQFFRDPEHAWRPYAAGLPWLREPQWSRRFQGLLTKLDAAGPDENSIGFIASESGAGGTTLARALSWRAAQQGYPVLVAKPLPFVPDALPLVNYMTRVLHAVESTSASTQEEHVAVGQDSTGEQPARYEPPWVVVFDSLHWEDREAELARFLNELTKSGRPACILLVADSAHASSYYNGTIFHEVAELNHSLTSADALSLGHHLNTFLRNYGKARQDWQWQQFHEQHAVRYLEGLAAFWITLSFWIQGEYNLSESIQEWMYRSFKEHATDRAIQDAILEIAALSSERLPTPESLLPHAEAGWPVPQRLEQSLSSLAPLGLLPIRDGTTRYWAMIHDILGRFLINALFYDFEARKRLGFERASDPEHLRFMILCRISENPMLSERAYQALGEDFATSIFKVDPDHGHGGFAALWRDVLEALDRMPQQLRDTNRVFRHHTAVSRRRIAKLDELYYGVTDEDRLRLLNRAIDDIAYALAFIEYTPGSEPNLNLYNSLANAYFDLAEVELRRGAPASRITELRQLANDATRRAYDENPTNSFVIETHVRNLLQEARFAPEQAISCCIEALGILFSALTANEAVYRAAQLGDLADRALAILFEQSPTQLEVTPRTATDVLLSAWKALAEDRENWASPDLANAPRSNQLNALKVLEHPAGRGSMQVIRMRYELTCALEPTAFREQLELVEQLQATSYRITPQLRLEYAILLYQNSRATEGDRVFYSLRALWRESEYFVYVPGRLRWLVMPDGKTPRTVSAFTGSRSEYRAMARVPDFGNLLVPFRVQEFGFRNLRPGFRFASHVSFGHNGPLLRPVTSRPATRAGGEVA